MTETMSCPLSMADCHSPRQSKKIKKMHEPFVSALRLQYPSSTQEKAPMQHFVFVTAFFVEMWITSRFCDSETVTKKLIGNWNSMSLFNLFCYKYYI